MGNRAVKMPNLPPGQTTNGNQPSPTHRFGVFEVDLRAGELRRSGMRVKLQDQPLQVLAQLLEHPGDVVTRDDLKSRLWPADTFVDFDHSLNAAIRRLRDALGDSAENPTFVETVARRGYRFLAPVSPGSGNGNSASALRVVAIRAPTRRVLWMAGAVAAVILISLGISVGFHLSKHASAPNRVTQLTANPVDDPVRAAAISSDGRYLAFSDLHGFYLRQIATGETHLISLPEGMMANAITWFPDSAHMILALAGENRSSSLWELSAMGGSLRKLLDNGNAPAISPDGKSIAYFAGQMLHQRVWVAGISGEQQRELAGGDGDMFGTIAWSPDGTRIAYTTARFTYGYGAKGEIAVVDLGTNPSGKERSPTVLFSLAGLAAPLAWAPDGRLLYTLEEPRPRQLDTNLWAVRLDRQARPVGSPVRLTNDQGSVIGANTSGDANRIIYVKGVPQPDVYVARLESSGALETPQRLTLDDHQDMPYDWTTDNKHVIFMSDRAGTFDIYKQAIDQTVPELLVSGGEPSESPRLSPDGSQIIYTVYPTRGDPKYEVPLMRVPLAGGTPHEILKAPWISNHQCARAPADVCIYSIVHDHDLTFFTFHPFRGPGAQVYQIKDELPQLYNWGLSPDGSTLAIAKGKWGNEEPRIRLVSLPGGGERWIAVHGWPGIAGLDWAADSKGLWAATSGDNENALLHIDFAGNVRAVWHPKDVRVGWAIPSRDGRYLALHVRSSSANVWMLDRP
jgi:Tol biopolymer transport system component/DNA-binding winged helix-turn-helix (wHTH) protein